MKAGLETQWIVGFVDGKGSFHVEIKKDPARPGGFQVLPEFRLFLDKGDIGILYRVKRFFQCGVVRHFKKNSWLYRVQNQKHLRAFLLPFFETHGLKTKKQQDFLKFRKILFLMESKEGGVSEGFARIQKIQKSMEGGV